MTVAWGKTALLKKMRRVNTVKAPDDMIFDLDVLRGMKMHVDIGQLTGMDVAKNGTLREIREPGSMKWLGADGKSFDHIPSNPTACFKAIQDAQVGVRRPEPNLADVPPIDESDVDRIGRTCTNSAGGRECRFYEMPDGTGWKIYHCKSAARVAYEGQKLLAHFDLAPDVLSGLVLLSSDGYLDRWSYVTEIVQSMGTTRMGYGEWIRHAYYECPQIPVRLVEGIECYDRYGIRDYLISRLANHNLDIDDLHEGNWGIKDGDIVVIDTGGCSDLMGVDQERTAWNPACDVREKHLRITDDGTVEAFNVKD